jgi:hypothetical protein
MPTTTRSFTKSKETKNTVVFTEDLNPSQAPVVGTIYVHKWWIGSAIKLNVTLEFA